MAPLSSRSPPPIVQDRWTGCSPGRPRSRQASLLSYGLGPGSPASRPGLSQGTSCPRCLPVPLCGCGRGWARPSPGQEACRLPRGPGKCLEAVAPSRGALQVRLWPSSEGAPRPTGPELCTWLLGQTEGELQGQRGSLCPLGDKVSYPSTKLLWKALEGG